MVVATRPYTRLVRVGIVGGGQLARMTAEAAVNLGVEVFVVEREAGSPAAQVVGSDHEIVGDWRDRSVLAALGDRVDVVTLENEFVEADHLDWLAARGTLVRPSPAAVRVIQDKLTQKQVLSAAGLPVPPFLAVRSAGEAREAGMALGWPIVLKARRNGYDG
jgi:5-(carboxyamino)imidazole ribonucleotide synthase